MGNQQQFFEALSRLSRMTKLDQGRVKECFPEMTEVIASTLRIERCSIWFYNTEMNAIILMDLFETLKNVHSEGMVLHEKDFPSYFKFMREARTLPASDALTHPATKEFKGVYLDPLCIKSMLDAPIIVDGKLLGVICCEKIGEIKHWSIEDESFTASVTDLIARGIMAKERLQAIDELKHMNDHLEEIVAERTEELERQRRITFKASKMALLGEMTSAIAHEINNPLAIIDGSIELLREMNERSPVPQATLAPRLDQMQKTLVRIEKIIKGLRFFARDSSSDQFVLTKVNDIIDDTLALCQGKLVKTNVKVTVTISQRDLAFECNPVAISQALLNLISNSLDALEDVPDRWLRIDCTDQGEQIEIRVTDSGKGISPEVKDKIMASFFTTKPAGKGTGLGLSIIRGIVDQHGGHFYLDENSPHTSFIMVIPKKL